MKLFVLFILIFLLFGEFLVSSQENDTTSNYPTANHLLNTTSPMTASSASRNSNTATKEIHLTSEKIEKSSTTLSNKLDTNDNANFTTYGETTDMATTSLPVSGTSTVAASTVTISLPPVVGLTFLTEKPNAATIRLGDNEEEEDDDEREDGVTLSPTSMTSSTSPSVATSQSSTLTSQGNNSSTGSQPVTESNTEGIVGIFPGNAADNSGFVTILAIVCSVSGVFVIVAGMVIFMTIQNKRKEEKKKLRRRHNSMPLERQRSFSNPTFLEHDVDILASRLSSSGSPNRGQFLSPNKGDNFFDPTVASYDEIEGNRVSKLDPYYVSTVENETRYHEIDFRNQNKQPEPTKQNRKNVLSTAYDYLRFKGMKSFGKSDRRKIIENEVQYSEDNVPDPNMAIPGSDLQFPASSLYDHVPGHKTQRRPADDNYDHVVQISKAPEHVGKKSENAGDDTKIAGADNGNVGATENFSYQDMFPPVDRTVDMYKQCPIAHLEPRTSL